MKKILLLGLMMLLLASFVTAVDEPNFTINQTGTGVFNNLDYAFDNNISDWNMTSYAQYNVVTANTDTIITKIWDSPVDVRHIRADLWFHWNCCDNPTLDYDIEVLHEDGWQLVARGAGQGNQPAMYWNAAGNTRSIEANYDWNGVPTNGVSFRQDDYLMTGYRFILHMDPYQTSYHNPIIRLYNVQTDEIGHCANGIQDFDEEKVDCGGDEILVNGDFSQHWEPAPGSCDYCCEPDWIDWNSCNGLNSEYTHDYYDLNECGYPEDIPLDNGTTAYCCVEDWNPYYTPLVGCDEFNSREKYYIDTNFCGTSYQIPADNGTTESCGHGGGVNWPEEETESTTEEITIIVPVESFFDYNGLYEDFSLVFQKLFEGKIEFKEVTSTAGKYLLEIFLVLIAFALLILAATSKKKDKNKNR